MKLSYLIELAQAAKERAYKPLNEGYKSSCISRIDKLFQKHMITNTSYKYGYISLDEET